MSDELKLLPCAHCASTELTETFTRATDTIFWWAIECECGASLHNTMAEEDARRIWNTRAIEATSPPIVTDEVVERVARALCRVVDGREDDWRDYIPEACAAIAAMPVVVQDGGDDTLRDAVIAAYIAGATDASYPIQQYKRARRLEG